MPVAGDQSIESRAQPNKRVVIMDGSRLVDPTPHFRSPDFNTTNAADASGVRAENTSLSTRITFTVPTGQRVRVVVDVEMVVQIAFTSSTTTDRNRYIVRFTPEGGSIQTIFSRNLNSVAVAAGDHIEGGIELWLDQGDVVIIADECGGDAAGAGRVEMDGSMHIEEFDA